nr:hypothetical protein [Pseudonocardia sp. ICBG1034]
MPVVVVTPEASRRVGVGPRADAELQASAGEGVQHAGVLGEASRVLQRQCDDGRPQPDQPGAFGDRGQQDQRRRQPPTEVPVVVLGHPERVVPEFLGTFGQPDRLAVGP